MNKGIYSAMGDGLIIDISDEFYKENYWAESARFKLNSMSSGYDPNVLIHKRSNLQAKQPRL